MDKEKVNYKISVQIIMRTLTFLYDNYRIILLSSFIYAAVAVSIVTYIYINTPLRSKAILEFNVNIDSKTKKFPNGSAFYMSQVVAPKIMSTVYEQDSLQPYFKSLEHFTSSISIAKTNDELMFLKSEYKNKLSSDELSNIAKLGLEQEYKNRKELMINSSHYNLIFDCAHTPRSLSKTQIVKILHDILRCWLNDAVANMNINKYNLSLHTKAAVTRKSLESLDFFMSMDILRKYLLDVGSDIQKIKDLPNTSNITISTPDGQLSISDLILKYDLLKNYQLEPLIGIIQNFAVYNQSPMMHIYLKNKLQSIYKEIDLLTEEKLMLQELKNNYATPDYSQIITINQKIIDLRKQLNFYQKMEESLEATKDRKTDYNSEELENRIKIRQAQLLQSIHNLIDLVHQFAQKINKANLGLRKQYYEALISYSNISRGISLKYIAIIAFSIWFVCVALTIKFIFICKHLIPILANRKKNGEENEVI